MVMAMTGPVEEAAQATVNSNAIRVRFKIFRVPAFICATAGSRNCDRSIWQAARVFAKARHPYVKTYWNVEIKTFKKASRQRCVATERCPVATHEH
jgi:hypothetical protein